MVFGDSVHEAFRDGLARQSRLSTAWNLMRAARRDAAMADGRLDAIVDGLRMVALRALDRLKIVAEP